MGYARRKTPGDTSWFVQDRFGMFIHWGLYSMPGRHEWVKSIEKMSDMKYDRYFKYFDPDMCNIAAWAKQAKDAGMKYVVFTAKHHEGFCMFDSKFTDYKCTNTPAKRDLFAEYTEAFRAEGLKVGVYYSLIDWHHPDFPVDVLHPRRTDMDAKAQNKTRDMKRYAEYMRNQVEELMTNYGKIDVFWFDFTYPDLKSVDNEFNQFAVRDFQPWMKGKTQDDWEAESLIEIVRKHNPNIIINNRTGIEQDLWTPEQYQPQAWLTYAKTGELVTWEACQTLSGSWGYYRDEMTWKSPEMLINMLIKTVSLGGNLLMNVGPTSRGYIDHRAEEALSVYANWMKYNARSIYGCTMAEPEFTPPTGTLLTQSGDGKRLYVHLIEYPYAFLEFKGISGKVDYAQFLHDGSEVLYTEGVVSHFSEGKTAGDNLVAFKLPHVKPGTLVPVIEIFLK